MSGFQNISANDTIISSDSNNPTTFVLNWQSFPPNPDGTYGTYLLQCNGYVVCPVTSGYINFDYYLNGVKVNQSTRTMQNSAQGSTPIATGGTISCSNCTVNTDSDGNTTYNNTLKLTLWWSKSTVATLNPPSPTANGIGISVIAVA